MAGRRCDGVFNFARQAYSLHPSVSFTFSRAQSSAMAWRSRLWLTRPAAPVIGFLNGGSPGGYAPYAAAFRQGLKEAGFVEGQNVAV
jgi:hypothetical protein